VYVELQLWTITISVSLTRRPNPIRAKSGEMVERGIRPQELAGAGLQEDVASADSLSDSAEMLFDQYEETGTFKDLEQAIHNMRKAVDITSQQQNPAQLAARHSTLGDMLLSKYKLAGKPEDSK
jgi:hypothetical protein